MILLFLRFVLLLVLLFFFFLPILWVEFLGIKYILLCPAIMFFVLFLWIGLVYLRRRF
jgi:hypothetical protein